MPDLWAELWKDARQRGDTAAPECIATPARRVVQEAVKVAFVTGFRTVAWIVAARECGLDLPPATDFSALPGRGVEATVGGRTLPVGGPRLLEQAEISVAPAIAERMRAAFALDDVIRPESRVAVATLREQGVHVAMLTGDSEDVARWVAGELVRNQATWLGMEGGVSGRAKPSPASIAKQPGFFCTSSDSVPAQSRSGHRVRHRPGDVPG